MYRTCDNALYDAMVSLAEAVWGNDKKMLAMAKYNAEKVREEYKRKEQ